MQLKYVIQESYALIKGTRGSLELTLPEDKRFPTGFAQLRNLPLISLPIRLDLRSPVLQFAFRQPPPAAVVAMPETPMDEHRLSARGEC